MSKGIADMIAAMSRGDNMKAGCELVYATWLGNALRVDSLPIDIPAEMVDVDDSLLEHRVTISMEIPAEMTSCKEIKIVEREMVIAARLKAGDKVFAVKTHRQDRYAVIGIYEQME